MRRLRRWARTVPTLTVLVPATMQALIEHPRWQETDLSALRAVTTGSTLVPQPLIDAVTARGVPVLQVYGSTETCPIAVYTPLGGDLSRGGSTGLPGLHCEARIVDEAGREIARGTPGEVVVRGPNVFFEYWGNEAATDEVLRNGWYHTGDIGTRDDDGYFYRPRPQEEHDHLGRREHLSGRDRTRAVRAPRSGGGCRDRLSRSEMAGGAGRLCGGAQGHVDRCRAVCCATSRRSSRASRCRAMSFSLTICRAMRLVKVQHFRLKELAKATR